MEENFVFLLSASTMAIRMIYENRIHAILNYRRFRSRRTEISERKRIYAECLWKIVCILSILLKHAKRCWRWWPGQKINKHYMCCYDAADVAVVSLCICVWWNDFPIQTDLCAAIFLFFFVYFWFVNLKSSHADAQQWKQIFQRAENKRSFPFMLKIVFAIDSSFACHSVRSSLLCATFMRLYENNLSCFGINEIRPKAVVKWGN